MHQVSDSGESNEHSLIALTHIAFPFVQQGRHSRMVIPELNTEPIHPLLTLPHAIAGRRGIARGRSGSLLLLREGLGFTPHLLPHAGFNRRFLDIPIIPIENSSSFERALTKPAGTSALFDPITIGTRACLPALYELSAVSTINLPSRTGPE